MAEKVRDASKTQNEDRPTASLPPVFELNRDRLIDARDEAQTAHRPAATKAISDDCHQQGEPDRLHHLVDARYLGNGGDAYPNQSIH